MRSASDFLSRCSLLRRPLCFTLLAAALTIPGLVADARQQPLSDVVSQRGSRTASGSRRAEIRFTDDSNLRLTLEVERIELATPYGKLQIPMAAVRRVEFATRVPTELTERLMGIVTDLESNQFRVREGASAELKKLGERAYSVLLQATKHKDQEVVQRAESLLKELRDAIPEELLEIRKHDVVHTRDSIIAGRIEAVSFKATTSQFGEVQLKLADMYSLQLLGADAGDHELARRNVGRRIQVLWGNSWWAAEILEVKNGLYHIHYSGHNASSDEWVTKDRIQFSEKRVGTPFMPASK
jgi:hypothetical protein